MSLLMDALRRAEKAKQDRKETPLDSATDSSPVTHTATTHPAPNTDTDLDSAESASNLASAASDAPKTPSTLTLDWGDDLLLIENSESTAAEENTEQTAKPSQSGINWDAELLPEFQTDTDNAPPTTMHDTTTTVATTTVDTPLPVVQAQPDSPEKTDAAHSIDWDADLITDYQQPLAAQTRSPTDATDSIEEIEKDAGTPEPLFIDLADQVAEVDAFAEADASQHELFLDLSDIVADTTAADPSQPLVPPPTQNKSAAEDEDNVTDELFLDLPDIPLDTTSSSTAATTASTQPDTQTSATPALASAHPPVPPPRLVLPEIPDLPTVSSNAAATMPKSPETTAPATAQAATGGLSWGFDVNSNADSQIAASPNTQVSESPEPTENIAAAQRVLQANQPHQAHQSTGLIALLIIGGLLLLFGGLGLGWYYYQMTFTDKSLVANLSPAYSPTVPPAAFPPDGGLTAVDSLPAELDEMSPFPVTPETALPTQLTNTADSQSEQPFVDTLPTIAVTQAPNRDRAPPSSVAVAQQRSATVPTVMTEVDTESPLSEPTQGVATMTAPETPPTIRLQNTQKTEHRKLELQLRTAYQAFQRGNVDTAQRIYQQIHQQQPTHRDALLGLAAVAIQQGKLQRAAEHYREVLRLHPQDSHAQAGLISLPGQLATSNNERQLQALLEKSPHADYLHFSLGSLYATQNRWAEAQQAFFQAYHHAQDEADYAYNLAVSLEHLNQSGPALQYYQRAAELAKTQMVNFDRARLAQRLQRLNQRVQVQEDGVYRSMPR